jgi:acetyl esterase/lipase
MIFKKVLIIVLLFTAAYPAIAGVKKAKDIFYVADGDVRHQLNIYYKKDVAVKKDVIIFIHGGSWNSGNKNTYWWLGRNFARKNVVSVIINYSLSPQYQYQRMATDCALAVAWVTQHINEYGGDPKRIFIMGHSAGAHLAALINQDPTYLKTAGLYTNPIKGVILDDPFSLNLYDYFKTMAPADQQTAGFKMVFTNNPEEWKKGSPEFYMEGVHNPYLVFRGGKTYPSITIQSQRYVNELVKLNKSAKLITIPGKSHIPMIAQMILGGNKMYKYILDFMKATA